MPQRFTLVGADPAIVIEERDTRHALAELDLREQDFDIACRKALMARDAVSDLAPRNQKGTAFWAGLIEALREELLPRQWDMDYLDGYDLIIHPDHKLAIVVTRGDENTSSNLEPRTYAKKGQNTRTAVRQNRRQLNLFDELGLPSVVAVPAAPSLKAVVGGLQLWFLLYHRNEDAELVEMELSLPEAVDGDCRPTSWRQRVPLRPVSFAESIEIDREPQPTYNEETIEVGVERRTHGS